MPACATKDSLADKPTISNLILPVPDTDFRDFLDEMEELARLAPEIIAAIEKDLDACARAKKKLRLEDRKFFESHTEDLPQLVRSENGFVTSLIVPQGNAADSMELDQTA